MSSEFIRLSTRDYVHDEDGERRAYRGDMEEQQPLTYSRQLAFWPWGGASGSVSSGQVQIDNRSGLYDQLVFRDLRDQPVSVIVPTLEGVEVKAMTAIVDSVEAIGDRGAVVSLKDRIALLDVPLQSEVYGQDADEGIQDRPIPITLGIARSVRPIAWQSEPASGGPRLRLHDSAISGLFEVRFDGEVQLSTDSPIPWEIDNEIGNAGIQLTSDVKALVAMDVSTSGDAFLATDPTDVIDGDGLFDSSFPTAYANPISDGQDQNVPGWLFRGRGFNQRSEANWISTGTGVQLKGGAHPGGYARLIKVNGTGTPERVFQAGKTYRWQMEMTRPVEYASVSGGVINSTGRFVLHIPSSISTAQQQPNQGTTLFLRGTFGADNVAGVYSGTFTVPEDSPDRFLELFTTNGGFAYFKGLKFFEVPPPPPDTLEGITLSNYQLEIIRRAGLPDSDISVSDLEEIDSFGEDIGIHFDRPITALAAMRAPLNSFTADLYTDRSGRFRFAQLRDPALEIPSLIVDQNNIAKESEFSIRIDDAPGLTTSMEAGYNWYVYRDSDFEDDSSVSKETRERLKQRSRFVRTAVVGIQGAETGSATGSQAASTEWPTVYRHAISAEPLTSVFDKPEAAAFEIQRVADIYATLRFFVEVEIYLEPGEFVEIDDVVVFKYKRFGFDEGRNMLVVGITDTVQNMARRRTALLTLWG